MTSSDPFRPSVAPSIWARFPEYRAISVCVIGYAPLRQLTPPPVQPAAWHEAHIEAWREAYRAFGAVPKKTPSSLESLLRRYTKDGQLPAISDLVDTYNALCLNWGAPFGGEDMARYVGPPRLEFASDGVSFDTAKDGQSLIETVDPGEVIWRDDLGATCRRWNWRQCKRTAITSESRNLWFVIDRLDPMPLAALEAAGADLSARLLNVSPGASVRVDLLAP
jgi:DNA/RNA-binding domain of Phe-tRNA-synthetase-like protein